MCAAVKAFQLLHESVENKTFIAFIEYLCSPGGKFSGRLTLHLKNKTYLQASACAEGIGRSKTEIDSFCVFLYFVFCCCLLLKSWKKLQDFKTKICKNLVLDYFQKAKNLNK